MPTGRWGSSPLPSGVTLNNLARSILPLGTCSWARPRCSESAASRAKSLLTVRRRKLRKRDRSLLVSLPCTLRVASVPPMPFLAFGTTEPLSAFCSAWCITCRFTSPCTSMPREVRLPSLQDASDSRAMAVANVMCINLFMCISGLVVPCMGYLLIILTLRLASPLLISNMYTPTTGRYRRVAW